ncbi:OsmC family protein [Companilactobacillus baiquanensis]|uniref:OsmC family protein n=1 Tax=Companilactobacillus baiquanensis TaxID=2486005 RepID=A0ABW1UW29_9LACO|nr:OsmC family protein [Companilactobacillus baiquanensis]
MANKIYKATVKPVEGLEVTSHVRDFDFTLDEPLSSGGTNKGMNPIEALLSALGACETMVAKSFAKSQGILLKNVKVEVEGVFDSDGYLGKNPEAKVGFSKLTSIFYIDADNTKEEIEKYVEFITKHCPVHDTIENAPVFEDKILPYE